MLTKVKLFLVRKFFMSFRIKGTVESYDLTFGGAGNQWTVIDGITYATYWDFFTKDWNTGDTVEFDVFYKPLSGRGSCVLQARKMRKA